PILICATYLIYFRFTKKTECTCKNYRFGK
ncbi:hypothetical protein AZZ66_000306, partial [Escherichia coli]